MDQENALLSSHLYKNVLESLEQAGDLIAINRNVLERLKKPRRAIMVSIPVRMDDGKVQVFNGYRVQHNHTLGPFKGGHTLSPKSKYGGSSGSGKLNDL